MAFCTYLNWVVTIINHRQYTKNFVYVIPIFACVYTCMCQVTQGTVFELETYPMVVISALRTGKSFFVFSKNCFFRLFSFSKPLKQVFWQFTEGVVFEIETYLIVLILYTWMQKKNFFVFTKNVFFNYFHFREFEKRV